MARYDHDPSRRTVLRTLAAAGIGLLSGGAAHGFLYERHRIGITRQPVRAAMLPPALDGLRIALLTDFHLSEMVPRTDIEHAVELTAAERPDLVVLGGDYVSHMDRRFVEPCAEILGRLSAPLGVFAVLGNHDDEAETTRALERHGIAVLRDARTTVTARGERIEVVGLRFWTRRTAEITRALRGATGWTLLLSHDPRRYTQAVSLNIPLVLSGHTHGGQIVLPGLGAIAARKFPVPQGLIVRENTTGFVSRGLGTIYIPCRVNCPPEVALLTLSPAIQHRAGAPDAPAHG